MGVFRLNQQTPFAPAARTPLLGLQPELPPPPPPRKNYRIIDESGPTIRPDQIMKPIPIHAGLVKIETPEMRKARRQFALQKQRIAKGVAQPLAGKVAQPPRNKNRQRKKPALPEGLYNGEVPRLYTGRNAVVMATGPGLTEEVVELIRPYHRDGSVVTFGCNDAFRIVPYLDVSYACDPPWMENAVKNYGWLDHPSTKWTQDRDAAPKHHLNWIAGTSGPDLSENQQLIHFGGNSGFQILNLALLYGCTKFLLVGYNMSTPGGKRHFFGDHPKPMSRSTSFQSFLQAFSTIKGAHRQAIFNCTPDTTLKHFEQRNLKEMLDSCRTDESDTK